MSAMNHENLMRRPKLGRKYMLNTRVALLKSMNGRKAGSLGVIQYYGISGQTPQGYLVIWDDKSSEDGWVYSSEEIIPMSNAGCKSFLKKD